MSYIESNKRDNKIYNTFYIFTRMRDILLIITLSILSLVLQAQNLEEGDITFDFGLGIGIYEGQYNQSNAGVLGLVMPTIDATYVMHPHWSVGAHLEKNTFTTSQEGNINYARSTGLGIKGSYMIINNELSTIYLSLITGPNTLRIKEYFEDESKASTMNFQFELGFKHYYKEHWGYFTTFALSNYNYKSLFKDDIRLVDPISGNNQQFKLSGVHLRAGFSYRL